jgi:hypothetical protein
MSGLVKSVASEAFEMSIQDAENLQSHFDKLNQEPLLPENGVLKRAGLVMAMTAWETRVEDRALEASKVRVAMLDDTALYFLITDVWPITEEEACQLQAASRV